MAFQRGYVKKATPPPELRVGQRVEASIKAITQVTGKFGEQLQFELELDNGYKCTAWIKFYEEPSAASALGKLGLAVMQELNEDHEAVEETVIALKKRIGRVFLECTGHREYEGSQYPKLKVVPTEFPPVPVKQGRIQV